MFRIASLARLVLFWCVFTLSAAAEESILSFHSRIEVQKNGDLLVTETIRVSAERNQIRRGIYRDFPQLYRGKWGLQEKRAFDVLEVTRDGVEEPYAIEAYKAGARVRIGDRDVELARGVYTYAIRYRTDRQLMTFDSHDELYWNVTGDEWVFPILEADAEVILPEGITVSSIEGYLGPAGSKERPAPETLRAPNHLSAGRVLLPDEGFTIVATWPPKSLDPTAYPAIGDVFTKDNPLQILSLGLLFLMLVWHVFAWFLVGRDPAPGVIIPQYEPPQGWSPAAVRMLSRMGFDNICFSAAVMGLAVKKRLSISGDKKTPTLHRSKTPPQETFTDDEKALFNALLGQHESVELIQKNHATVSGARTALQQSLNSTIKKIYFTTNVRYWALGFVIALLAVGVSLLGVPDPSEVGFILLWLSVWTVGTSSLVTVAASNFRSGDWKGGLGKTLFALPFLLGWIAGAVFMVISGGVVLSGIFMVAVVSNIVFYHLIKAPTKEGRKVLDHIDGFRHYLSVAEEERFRNFRGPEKTPELFEKFLPYAHALGVEQAWSRQFAEVLAAAARSADGSAREYRPSFYTGSVTGYDGAMTAAALGGALSAALTTASTSPSSSGSGGGGSSGGGGGGGGGGGW